MVCRLAAPDLEFTVLMSNDLASWGDAGATGEILSDDGATQLIAARITAPAGPECFFTVRVRYAAP